MPSTPRSVVLASAVTALASAALTGWFAPRCTPQPRQPSAPDSASSATTADTTLVGQLLAEQLDDRTFAFATVAEAASGRTVLPLDPANPVHKRIRRAIEQALQATLDELNRPDSPVRALRRINEASRFFEDGLHARLNATPGMRCEIPPNRRGDAQRSGYPDLRITDAQTATVFYLDPKLVEDSSWRSTLRTFYFEPKNETLKITDDAVHLLAGIGHDGKDGAWTFTGFKLIDLSTLRVRLKAEFQASNADLYQDR